MTNQKSQYMTTKKERLSYWSFFIGQNIYYNITAAFISTYLAMQGDKTVLKLHKDTVELVKATSQAKFADRLKPHLTEDEMDYYRRGKNAHTHAHPKGATRQEYAKATGLETLFGALYLLGRTERLHELFAICMEG